MKHLRTLTLSALALTAIGAHASNFFAATDKFGYTGDVSVYDSLADAQSETNPRNATPYEILNVEGDSQDGSLYVSGGANPYDAEGFYFLTAWWYTTDGRTNGWGNPNNNNTGFIQLFDPSIVNDLTGEFTTLNVGGTDDSTFSLSANGANATNADAFSRFWNAPETGGPAVETAGEFVEWDFALQAEGLSVVENAGYYEANDHPSNVTGHFRGIFHNQSFSDDTAAYDGFYVFDVTFNNDSWAWDNRADLKGDFDEFSDSLFAAPVPEPTTMAALGIGALALMRRRRNK
jgi:hypothetical protein